MVATVAILVVKYRPMPQKRYQNWTVATIFDAPPVLQKVLFEFKNFGFSRNQSRESPMRNEIKISG